MNRVASDVGEGSTVVWLVHQYLAHHLRLDICL